MTHAASSVSFQTEDQSAGHGMIRAWLVVIALMVVAMVIVGGATRLTDSGLSITEWKPIHGVIPPLNHAEWLEEFEKYRQIPEYQLINKGMSLDEFKFIFWWEWGHRLLGRLIGVVFAIPLAVFWVSGRVPGWLKPRLLFLFCLGGLQGVVGWWMVVSGLVERTDVSQYRLAVHLTLAFLILAYTVWLWASLTPQLRTAPPGIDEGKRRAIGLTALIIVQVFLGGLVAGLDAGLTFNTWPLMDGAIIPDGLWIQQPVLLNHFENVATVQFQHRMTAYLLVVLALYVAWKARQGGIGPMGQGTAMAVAVLVVLQAITGIATLIFYVPLSWALIHQGLAAIVLIAAIMHLRTVTPADPTRQ